MRAIIFRIALLTAGIGLAEMGLDSSARGYPFALLQLALALVLLVAGSAGFIVPLLEGGREKEIGRDV